MGKETKEQNQFLSDFDRAFSKQWILIYENNEILVKNEVEYEELYINGKCVAYSKRKNFLSNLKPYQKLRATIPNANGSSSLIEVSLGGFLTINLKIKIDGEIIFKDKINIFK